MTLKEAREIAGLTQTELAVEAGCTQTTIYDLENDRNRRPAFATVVRIVRAFHRRGLRGITAEELFPVPEHSEEVA